MTKKISKQMITGKSFEFALLNEFKEKLSTKTTVEVIDNNSLEIAKDCFSQLNDTEQSRYKLSASFAVNFLMDVEPRLSNGIDEKDALQLEIMSDDKGKQGDVRDVVAIRLVQKWEIGVSAKNNHKAVRHQRLSDTLDFGEKWLDKPCSQIYFNDVCHIFSSLRRIRKNSGATTTWKSLGDFHTDILRPILEAFKTELLRIHNNDQQKTAEKLVEFLIGSEDFYKVIQTKKAVEIQAFNLRGSLNKAFNSIKPKYITPRVMLPTRILDISFIEGRNNTLIVKLDNEWSFSFRIHNASSRVEPSLKFDVTLLTSPKSLFKNTLKMPTTKKL